MSVRLGIAGVAGMGVVHLISFKEHDDVDIAAICDVWPKALDNAGNAVPDAKRFTDFDEMCGSDVVDAVLIATPNGMHAGNVHTALDAGLHVYCEKPLALTVSDCKAIAGHAASAERIVHVGFQHRFQHGYASAKRIVDSDELGPLRRAEMRSSAWFRPNVYFAKRPWRSTWAMSGGGVLMNQAIHQLDAFLWITGMPSSVSARAWSSRPDVEVEDDLYAILEFPNGARGALSASTLDPSGRNRLDLVGDGGALQVEDTRLRRASWDGPTSKVMAESTNAFERVPASWDDVAETGLPLSDDDCLHASRRHFVEAISNDKASSINANEGTLSVEVANAVYLSAMTGERVDLPLDPQVYDEAFRRMCAGELTLETTG